MIAAPSLRAIVTGPGYAPCVCPACHSKLGRERRAWHCGACERAFPDSAGISDLRLLPDRYLSLEEDRAKAVRLSRVHSSRRCRDEFSTKLAVLSEAYYDMTGDVDGPRATRYLAHLARAESRGEAFVHLLPRSGRVLEIGCGSGGMLAAARSRGITIQGIDVASRWLVLARERLQGAAAISAANAERLPWVDGSFDAILADSVVEHLEDLPAALREWKRVARPSGRLILVSPNRWSLLSDPHVGLWGLGWLPRTRQVSYARMRKGYDWPLHLRSACEVARLAASAGWRIRRVGAAPAPDRGFASSVYEAARPVPLLRSFLRQVGPLWLVEAVREASP